MMGAVHPTDEWDRIRKAGEVAADRRAREAAEAERGRAANATPQTLAKRPLRRDAVQRLVDDGRLRHNQQRAAGEIFELWTSITRALFAKTSRYGDGGGDVDADWRPSLCRAYRERYIPWREEVSREPIGRVTLADLVFFVAVDNDGINVAARRAGVHRDTALWALQRGLFAYCRIGGWLEQNQRTAMATEAA